MDRLEPDADADAPHEARFTTEQYYRISDSGALDGYAKTELHAGRIVVMNAQYVPHGRAKTRLGFALHDSVMHAGLDLEVLIETDIEIADGEVLQPDVLICDPVSADQGVPCAAVRLVVEVADSSKVVDLGRKRLRYAAAGVAEYWVAVLETASIERFVEPADGDYRRHDSFPFAGGCVSLTLPGVAVPTGTLRG